MAMINTVTQVSHCNVLTNLHGQTLMFRRCP